MLVVLASCALYAPSLGNDFTWDDRAAAMGVQGELRHPLVVELRPLDEYLTNGWWPHHAPAARAWRPLTTFGFALRYAICGDEPHAEHALNILLHGLGAALCLLLLRALGASARSAALGALVFGLHAIHSESVISIVGRAELLALGCGLGATLLLTRALAKGRWYLSGIAGVLLLSAAKAKESGLAWCLCAPLLALLAHARTGALPPRRALATVVAPALVAASIYLWLYARFLASLPSGSDPAFGRLENPLLGCEPAMRALSGMLAWGYGALLTAMPFHLSADYGAAQLVIVRSWTDTWAAAAVLTGAVLVVGFGWLAWQWRARPLLSAGSLLFVAFSLPLANIAAPV
ncbi:MAG: hypothetical protein ABIP94_08085, partial [Planctomycetota bacterium]